MWGFKVAMVGWIAGVVLLLAPAGLVGQEMMGSYGSFVLAKSIDPITDVITLALVTEEIDAKIFGKTHLVFSCEEDRPFLAVLLGFTILNDGLLAVTHRIDRQEPQEKRWLADNSGIGLLDAVAREFAHEMTGGGRLTLRLKDFWGNTKTYQFNVTGLEDGLSKMPCYFKRRLQRSLPEGTLVCRSRSALELYVSGDSSSIGECERVASESKITVMFDHGDVAMIRVYGMALYTWVQAAAIAGS